MNWTFLTVMGYKLSQEAIGDHSIALPRTNTPPFPTLVRDCWGKQGGGKHVLNRSQNGTGGVA